MYPAVPVYPPPTRPTNGTAIASLVCGIVSWVALPLIPAVVAVICGHSAKRQIARTGEQGQGLATAGIVLGWLNIAFSVLGICVFGVLLLGCFGSIAAIPFIDPSFDPTPVTPTPFPTGPPTGSDPFPTGVPTATPFPTA